MIIKTVFSLFILSFNLCTFHLNAQSDEAISAKELTRQMVKSVTGLIRVPFQDNLNFNLGSNEGFRYHLIMQPVGPVSISENCNMLNRTILPFSSQSNVFIDGKNESSFVVILQNVFYLQKKLLKMLIYGGLTNFLIAHSYR